MKPARQDARPWLDLWKATREEQVRRAWDNWEPVVEILTDSPVKIWVCVREDVLSFGRTPLEALTNDRKDLIRYYDDVQRDNSRPGDLEPIDLEGFLREQDATRPAQLLEIRAPPTLNGFDALQFLRTYMED